MKTSSAERVLYYVADYQRGYRFTSQQVTESLDDLEFFQKSDRDKDAFYSLQRWYHHRRSDGQGPRHTIGLTFE